MRTASAAMVSSRLIAESGLAAGFFRRISARSNSALPRIPVNGLLSLWRRISAKDSRGDCAPAALPGPESKESCAIRRCACKRFSTQAAASGNCESSLGTKSAAPAAISAARLSDGASAPKTTPGAKPASADTTSARGEVRSPGNEDEMRSDASSRTITSGTRSARLIRAAAKLATAATRQERSDCSSAERTAEHREGSALINRILGSRVLNILVVPPFVLETKLHGQCRWSDGTRGTQRQSNFLREFFHPKWFGDIWQPMSP